MQLAEVPVLSKALAKEKFITHGVQTECPRPPQPWMQPPECPQTLLPNIKAAVMCSSRQ